ncbi:MAG TPA: hypothetical protein VNO26_07510 [Candidatus Limnocylindria bacterium]|nr:hypothetical protein [Candidatus Limnocylindria bacterium]
MDIPVVGLKLIMVDKTAVGGGAKVTFVSKDANVAKGMGTDAANIFAGMSVAYDGKVGSFVMPPGSSWVVNKPTVAKYSNGAAPSGGSVKVSVVKPGLLVKTVAKSLGDSPIDISAPPAGSVYVSYAVANEGDGYRHCTQFGTCVHKVVAGGSGYKLVCKGDSTGDPTCSGATPQCCSVAALSLCGHLDPFLCVLSGGTVGGAASSCDSVTGTCGASASAGNCCAGIFGDGGVGPFCIAGPFVDTSVCAEQGGTHTASAVCQPDGSCS